MDRVFAAAFSPDGGRIITASIDGTARLWDGETGTPLAVLKGHTNGVVTAAFSPDGERVVTGSWDGTARLWVVGPEQLLAEARRQLLPMLTLAECQQFCPADCPADTAEIPLP